MTRCYFDLKDAQRFSLIRKGLNYPTHSPQNSKLPATTPTAEQRDLAIAVRGEKRAAIPRKKARERRRLHCAGLASLKRKKPPEAASFWSSFFCLFL